MIDSLAAQKVISQYRSNAIVVTTMTTAHEWPGVSTRPHLDMPEGFAMGKASSQALGFAIARPDMKVIVLDGDGSLLMNLGTLVTIAHISPPNLVHFVFDNGVYRMTGGQPIPNSRKINFSQMARAAGIACVYEFDDLDSFKKEIEIILNQIGPIFVWLKVPSASKPAPHHGHVTDQMLNGRIPQFMTALQHLSK